MKVHELLLLSPLSSRGRPGTSKNPYKSVEPSFTDRCSATELRAGLAGAGGIEPPALGFQRVCMLTPLGTDVS